MKAENVIPGEAAKESSVDDILKKRPPKKKNSEKMQNSERRNKRTITLELLRKRSEHNEGMVSSMEEIALHQEELESIGTTIGRTCGKTLQILLLQNNVISSLSLSEMKYFKVLRYLNLALNNITNIQGLNYCHELQKLDLTLNFIDFDAFQASVQHLKLLPNLQELYLLGNPCFHVSSSTAGNLSRPSSEYKTEHVNNDDDSSCSRNYVIAMIPHLKQLDGKDIQKSERILALQQLACVTNKIENYAKQCEANKGSVEDREAQREDRKELEGPDETTNHTPESRAHTSQKMADQRAKKEEQQRANQPHFMSEKEWKEEQDLAVLREREYSGAIRQKNEGKWTYHWEDEHPDYIRLDVSVPKYLSTSLIDVDVHPTFLTIIIKSKVLRLRLPEEVKSGESKAQRSTITGHLLVTMPRLKSINARTRILDYYQHEDLSNPIPQAFSTKPQNNAVSRQPKTSSSSTVGEHRGIFYEMVQEGCRKTSTILATDSPLSYVGNTSKLENLATLTTSGQALVVSEDTACSNMQETQTRTDCLEECNGLLLQDECNDEPPALL